MKEYQRFSPDSVNGSESTAGLKRNIDKDDNHSGISFAVPITQVINKIKELEEGPVAKRKILNADIVDVKDSEILYKNNFIDITKENYGVAVVSSDENSPLKKGDVILEINNNKVVINRNNRLKRCYVFFAVKENVKEILNNHKDMNIKDFPIIIYQTADGITRLDVHFCDDFRNC